MGSYLWCATQPYRAYVDFDQSCTNNLFPDEEYYLSRKDTGLGKEETMVGKDGGIEVKEVQEKVSGT